MKSFIWAPQRHEGSLCSLLFVVCATFNLGQKKSVSSPFFRLSSQSDDMEDLLSLYLFFYFFLISFSLSVLPFHDQFINVTTRWREQVVASSLLANRQHLIIWRGGFYPGSFTTHHVSITLSISHQTYVQISRTTRTQLYPIYFYAVSITIVVDPFWSLVSLFPQTSSTPRTLKIPQKETLLSISRYVQFVLPITICQHDGGRCSMG